MLERGRNNFRTFLRHFWDFSGSFWDLSGTSPSPPIVTPLLNRGVELGRRSRRSNNVEHRSRRSNKVEHIVH